MFQSNQPMISSADDVVVKSLIAELSESDTEKLLKDKKAVATLLRFESGPFNGARSHEGAKETEENEENEENGVSKIRRDSADSIASTKLTIQKVKTKKSCQKVKTTRNNAKNSLSVTFIVDDSSCNWWIILVAVVGAVVLLVIIAIIIIVLLPSRYRAKLQPFHKSQDAPTRRTAAYTKDD